MILFPHLCSDRLFTRIGHGKGSCRMVCIKTTLSSEIHLRTVTLIRQMSLDSLLAKTLICGDVNLFPFAAMGTGLQAFIP